MRASFVFSEVLTGLRRNVTMTVAMILTTTISLALLGVGLLIVRMIDKTEDLYREDVEVSIFLTDTVSESDDDCSLEPCRSLMAQLRSDPAVREVRFENREQAYQRFKRIFETQPELVALARPESLPASLNLKLHNPDRPEVIIQTYTGKAGVQTVTDQNEFLERFFNLFNGVRNVTFVIALFQAVAAMLLITNMVQISAFTRRTEVGIMRLVGATRWYTQLPFLLEAVVAGLVGAFLGIGLLVGFKAWFLDTVLTRSISSEVIRPPDGLDILLVSPWLLLTAIGISAITGYVTLRMYVRT